MTRLITIVLVAISMLYLAGCAPKTHVGRSFEPDETPFNQVIFLDGYLSSRISVKDIGSRRTGTNTLEVWTNLRNISSRSYDLAIRTHFFDMSGRQLEVTEWQMFFIGSSASETYRTRSIHQDVGYYNIEVKELRKPEHRAPRTQRDEAPVSRRVDMPFSFGTGYGCSYAGVGVKLQFETLLAGVRVAFHIGGGYVPVGRGWFSANEGVKVYVFRGLYLNGLFGFFDAYEEEDASGAVIDEGRIYGPAALIGYDLNINQNFGINIGYGVAYDMNYENEIHNVFDAGLFLRF